jgi:hypothetical protein
MSSPKPKLPQRTHTACAEHGCRSMNHLVCPNECELLHNPDPDLWVNRIPLSIRPSLETA